MTKDNKPWEGEKAPEPQEGAAPVVETPAKDPDGTPKAQEKRVAKAGIVVNGDQASLSLINLVSRGMSMADAKKKLGIE